MQLIKWEIIYAVSYLLKQGSSRDYYYRTKYVFPFYDGCKLGVANPILKSLMKITETFFFLFFHYNLKNSHNYYLCFFKFQRQNVSVLADVNVVATTQKYDSESVNNFRVRELYEVIPHLPFKWRKPVHLFVDQNEIFLNYFFLKNFRN